MNLKGSSTSRISSNQGRIVSNSLRFSTRTGVSGTFTERLRYYEPKGSNCC